MSDSNPPREAFKVRIGDYLSEHELEGLGISADWFLYLSPTIRPALATCFTQFNTYELLACPCCGGTATIIGTYPTNEFSAICRDCGLETAHKLTPKDAALAWNKRHAPDEEGAALDAQAGMVMVPKTKADIVNVANIAQHLSGKGVTPSAVKYVFEAATLAAAQAGPVEGGK